MFIRKGLLALNRPLLKYCCKCRTQFNQPISVDSNLFSTGFTTSSKQHNISPSVKPSSQNKSPLVGKSAPLTLSEAAVHQIKRLMAENPKAGGLRIGVRTRGCNGLSYTMEFSVEDKKPGDEVVEQNGIRLFIDRRAQLTLLGTEMDFQEGLLGSQFVFNNPNVKSTCGCGESFNI